MGGPFITAPWLHQASIKRQSSGALITQKYLVAGHTQMECDSMYSAIERKIVTDVFTPRDYVIILQTPRIRPSPYHVKLLKHGEFQKMNGSYFTSIRPGKKPGDPTVHQLQALQFSSVGKVHFKLSFGKNCHREYRCQMSQ